MLWECQWIHYLHYCCGFVFANAPFIYYLACKLNTLLIWCCWSPFCCLPHLCFKYRFIRIVALISVCIWSMSSRSHTKSVQSWLHSPVRWSAECINKKFWIPQLVFLNASWEYCYSSFSLHVTRRSYMINLAFMVMSYSPCFIFFWFLV